MRIIRHILKDGHFDNWHTEVLDRWDYDDLMRDDSWRRDWISFDCCLYVPETAKLYCGITSLEGEVFWAFDPSTGTFTDPGYRCIRDRFDAKLHRSLVRRDADGALYGAVALLHDIDHYREAPGGAIFRYEPDTGAIAKLAIPLPHLYIQSICLDQRRDVIYGLTFPPERMFRFDLQTLQTTDLGPISGGCEMTQGEAIALDDDGCAWSAWTIVRAWQQRPGPDSRRLCKYDPREGRIRFFKTGLPGRNGNAGMERLDGIFNLGTGCLFASGGNGSLYRIDPETAAAAWIATPIDDRPSRLSSLRLGPDGAAYGVAGVGGACEVVRFDPRAEKFERLGCLADGEVSCWQVHDVAITPEGTLFACENDNPRRSSYLWQIEL